MNSKNVILNILLLTLRKDNHLTQPAAAVMMGVKLRIYQYYEAGTRPLPPARLELLQFKLAAK